MKPTVAEPKDASIAKSRCCEVLPFSSSSTGKNVKRSIHGMGQMMSTMVLNRKQSIFGGSGQRGAGLVLDGQRGSKDSIDKMDLTVMDTKLKILEILQVFRDFSCSR